LQRTRRQETLMQRASVKLVDLVPVIPFLASPLSTFPGVPLRPRWHLCGNEHSFKFHPCAPGHDMRCSEHPDMLWKHQEETTTARAIMRWRRLLQQFQSKHSLRLTTHMHCVVSAAETQLLNYSPSICPSIHELRRNYDTRALTDGFQSD